MQKYEWLGAREKDNFSYTRGGIPIYDPTCNNSIIISNLEKGITKRISNHALIETPERSYLIPITEIDEIIGVSKEILKRERIFYKKPNSIFEMQTLEELSEKEIKQKILENYNIEIKNLFEVKTKKGNNRVYKVVSKEDKEFMLKYQGKDQELFEVQASFLKNMFSFPRIMPTINSNHFILFQGNLYALEEFIGGEKFPLNKENYFELVGKHLALMHNEFNKRIIPRKNLENVLIQEGNPLNESNLISMQIDLDTMQDNEYFLKEIASFSDALVQTVNSFPDQIIHGDLNKSNLIWNENNATTIDSETIQFSKRIRDFIPALLFEGNLNTPSYTPNSLKELIDSYDLHSTKGLSKDEKNILPELLKFSLIKSYVIYVLRRNLEDEDFKNQIINNLEILGGETNVH